MPSHNCIIITMFSFQGAVESQRNSKKFPWGNFFQFLWWRLAGSNRWPPACKAGALPAELNPHISIGLLSRAAFQVHFGVPAFGTQSFQSWLLFSSFRRMVGQNGLEPSTSRLSVVCSSQLSYWPILDFFTSHKKWWRLAGSNRWPPACKAGALPAELNPHIIFHLCKYTLSVYPLNWIMWNLTLCTDQ